MDKNEVKKEAVVNDLKRKIEYCKQKELLAAIFFDGEDRSRINYWKNKRKEVEEMLKKC
jgi:hypothetical protein